MRLSRNSVSGFLMTLVLCSACATDRGRRPPPDNPGKSPPRESTMIAHPISLLFASMDQNQDALVDKNELSESVLREWARMTETNHASALHFETWSQTVLGARNALPSFIAFDSDLDGRISMSDFSGHLYREFDRLDNNQDDLVARSELLFQGARSSQGSERGGDARSSRGEGRKRPR